MTHSASSLRHWLTDWLTVFAVRLFAPTVPVWGVYSLHPGRRNSWMDERNKFFSQNNWNSIQKPKTLNPLKYKRCPFISYHNKMLLNCFLILINKGKWENFYSAAAATVKQQPQPQHSRMESESVVHEIKCDSYLHHIWIYYLRNVKTIYKWAGDGK